VDQWLAAGNPQSRWVFIGSTLLGKDGRPAQEWDVLRIDLDASQTWQVAAVECAVNRTGAKDAEAREKLELLGAGLQQRFADLSRYEALLATVKRGDLDYEDSRRGFGR
jgi:hypothetical protein